MNEPPTSRRDRDDFPYTVQAKVGEGAMGMVYRAREEALERTVAIKVMGQGVLQGLQPAQAEQLQLRFLQEARAAAALSHPGVTTIYRVGRYRDQPYIAMEWLDGQDLEARLSAPPQPPLPEVARWGVEILSALHAAHRAGVVHRDIKPSNIMLLTDGRLKVTDFGIAHVQDSSLVKTQAGAMIGTPQYASPEQLTGKPLDGRADLFSCGVLLYQALTGELPFDGATYIELAHKVLSVTPPSPRDLNPAIPPEVAAVIMRALDKQPGGRFADAGQMAAALRPFMARAGGASPGHDAHLETAERPSTLDLGMTASQRLIAYEALPAHPLLALRTAIESWPAQALPTQETHALLARLIERPLHAQPFAGGVRIGDACLLVHDGLILAAFDPLADLRGDEVIERLPARAEAHLHPLLDLLDDALLPLLASLVHPRAPRHEQLDAAIVNLPALARRLESERFTGVVRMQRGAAFAITLLVEGAAALTLACEGWGAVNTDAHWASWPRRCGALTCVDEPVTRVASFCYRHALESYALDVSFGAPGAAAPRMSGSFSSVLLSDSDAARAGQTVARALQIQQPSIQPAADEPRQPIDPRFADDPMLAFLDWMLFALPIFFKERKRTEVWKYLAGWVPLVRRAWLHHPLPRPGEREADPFDLVTDDGQGKVLHLARRVAVGTPETFKAFVDAVLAAKTARIKTGDVGGALFIARRFEGDMLAAYREATQVAEKSGSRWFFGLQRSLTGYEGFVRIGARRGFHLLPVLETDDGFVPVLPDEA